MLRGFKLYIEHKGFTVVISGKWAGVRIFGEVSNIYVV